MPKYLLPEQLKTTLNLGKGVEQWLGYQKEDGYTVLKWLSIHREKSGEYMVMYTESFDEGDEDFLDIYDFSCLNPDEPAIMNSFDSIEEAIKFCQETYNASIDKYVTAGMIQEECANYLTKRDLN